MKGRSQIAAVFSERIPACRHSAGSCAFFSLQTCMVPSEHPLLAALSSVQTCMVGHASRQCTACSAAVVGRCRESGWPFVLEALRVSEGHTVLKKAWRVGGRWVLGASDWGTILKALSCWRAKPYHCPISVVLTLHDPRCLVLALAPHLLVHHPISPPPSHRSLQDPRSLERLSGLAELHQEMEAGEEAWLGDDEDDEDDD